MNKTSEYIYRGFDLQSITWGYRDRFKNAIDELYEENFLGSENIESTEIFFDLLKKGSKEISSCYDHVLNNFICSLNVENRWILRVPALFSDWSGLGATLTQHKLYMGMGYFEVWGRGGFGNTPEDVEYVLNKARWLVTIDFDLGYSFIQAYSELSKVLCNSDIDIFIENTLILFDRSPKNAFNFLKLKTKTARLYAETISKDVRLSECKGRLVSLAQGLSGCDIELADFSHLDSDDILERGSSVVSINKRLYLPAKVSYFHERKGNLEHYMLVTAISSAALNFNSFNAVHGARGARNSMDYIYKRGVNDPVTVNNCFLVSEIYRIISLFKSTYAGIYTVLKTALEAEVENRPIASPADKIIVMLLKTIIGKVITPSEEEMQIINMIKDAARNSASFTDLLNWIEQYAEDPPILSLLKRFFYEEIHPIVIFPDFMFPALTSEAGEAPTCIDLKDRESAEENAGAVDNENDNDKKEMTEFYEKGANDKSGKEEEEDKNKIQAGYFYDEWNQLLLDYYENWCCLKEKPVPVNSKADLNEDYHRLSKEVKKVFEKLKPDQVRREKYLREGDDINIDMLIEYLSQQQAEIPGTVRFYEKPYIRQRDLSVAVLIDMSGSTGEEVEDGRKIIDIEKKSAYILGEGLAEIGDRFGIFGFSGSGRENAEFYLIKDFEDAWDQRAKDSLFSVSPKSSTRIGVALRHTGYKLQDSPTLRKLIILITDGKPMDSFYEYSTRYAQYDVRKANEENYRAGIDTFCISTEENQIEDLEIMFPFHRYVIVKNMVELPVILSRFYLNITK
jgi:hypothetical protein